MHWGLRCQPQFQIETQPKIKLKKSPLGLKIPNDDLHKSQAIQKKEKSSLGRKLKESTQAKVRAFKKRKKIKIKINKKKIKEGKCFNKRNCTTSWEPYQLTYKKKKLLARRRLKEGSIDINYTILSRSSKSSIKIRDTQELLPQDIQARHSRYFINRQNSRIRHVQSSTLQSRRLSPIARRSSTTSST